MHPAASNRPAHTRNGCHRRGRRTRIGTAALAACLACGIQQASALESDRDQPIRIQARTVQLDEKTGVAIYRGAVVLTQGSMRITAERVEVHLRDRRPERILASGQPATFTMRLDGREAPLHAEAERLEYQASARRARLLGAARVRQGADSLMAETIQYWLDEDRLEAEAAAGDAGRVHAVITPPRRERRDEAAQTP